MKPSEYAAGALTFVGLVLLFRCLLAPQLPPVQPESLIMSLATGFLCGYFATGVADEE